MSESGELLLSLRGRGEEEARCGRREKERKGEERSTAYPTYAALNDREREVQSAAVNYPFGRRRV